LPKERPRERMSTNPWDRHDSGDNELCSIVRSRLNQLNEHIRAYCCLAAARTGLATAMNSPSVSVLTGGYLNILAVVSKFLKLLRINGDI
jgi:hypothetical protein